MIGLNTLLVYNPNISIWDLWVRMAWYVQWKIHHWLFSSSSFSSSDETTNVRWSNIMFSNRNWSSHVTRRNSNQIPRKRFSLEFSRYLLTYFNSHGCGFANEIQETKISSTMIGHHQARDRRTSFLEKKTLVVCFFESRDFFTWADSSQIQAAFCLSFKRNICIARVK